MPACEKCWRDSAMNRYDDGYERLLKERNANPCTPEEQAGGQYADRCVPCGRQTVHMYAKVCMACGRPAYSEELLAMTGHSATEPEGVEGR
jgi:hypothetical protein